MNSNSKSIAEEDVNNEEDTTHDKTHSYRKKKGL